MTSYSLNMVQMPSKLAVVVFGAGLVAKHHLDLHYSTAPMAVRGLLQGLCVQHIPQCSWFASLQLTHQQHGGWSHNGNSSSSSNNHQQPALHQQHRGKHTVRMVLLRDDKILGDKGDIIVVKAGHARNHLFPDGIADYAIPAVIRKMKAQGLLSEQALRMLSRSQEAAVETVQPAALPLEQQLPEIIRLLTSKHLVISRGFSWKQQDNPMVGELRAQQLALYAAKQLHIDLPRELIMMDDATPITEFGTYKVPLNLRTADGQQVELSVQVNKTYRSPGLRRMRLWAEREGLIPVKPQQRHANKQQPQQ